jgi:hypothetical protein
MKVTYVLIARTSLLTRKDFTPPLPSLESVIMTTCLLQEWSCEDVRVLCPQQTGNVTRSGTEILIMLEGIINALFAPALSTISLLSFSSWDKAYRLPPFMCVSDRNFQNRTCVLHVLCHAVLFIYARKMSRTCKKKVHETSVEDSCLPQCARAAGPQKQ